MRTGGIRYGKELDTSSYILHHTVGTVRHKTNACDSVTYIDYLVKDQESHDTDTEHDCTILLICAVLKERLVIGKETLYFYHTLSIS